MKITSFWKRATVLGMLALAMSAAAPSVTAATLSADMAKKVDAMILTIKQWSAQPAVVSALKSRNRTAPAEIMSMTQEKWAEMSVLDPTIRGLAKNDAAKALKAIKTEAVTEMFLNAADGTKVALLAKTSGWSHAGSAKHDTPMRGEVWKGDVEVDESTGLEQIQVSVPVLDGDTPIGSLVVGLGLASLN